MQLSLDFNIQETKTTKLSNRLSTLSKSFTLLANRLLATSYETPSYKARLQLLTLISTLSSLITSIQTLKALLSSPKEAMEASSSFKPIFSPSETLSPPEWYISLEKEESLLKRELIALNQTLKPTRVSTILQSFILSDLKSLKTTTELLIYLTSTKPETNHSI
jgi:hypothetical protein